MDTVFAICKDDRDRPNEIPLTKWLKKDKIYEVEWAGYVGKGDINIHLVEPKLGLESLPYTGFSHRRFRFNSKNESQKIEEVVSSMLKEVGL